MIQRLKDFFGLNASMSAMVLMVVLIGSGEKMAERFLPLYILALGGTPFAVGLLNALNNLLGALYSLPGGYAADRLGYRKSLLFFTGMAMTGYLVVVFVPHWSAVLVGSVLFIAWSAISLPAIMSLVFQAVPADKRTMGVTVHSFVRRIPMAIGPVLGGLIIGAFGTEEGIRIAFMMAFLLGAFSLLVQYRWIEDKQTGASHEAPPWKMFGNIGPSLRHLLVADIFVRFAEQIPYAFVVVWVVRNQGMSALDFGTLTAVEMITAMLIYIPVAYLSDKYQRKKPFVTMTFFFFSLFPLVLLYSQSFAAMVVAFVVRGLKEFGEPTRKALIMELAPKEARAGTFGAYYLIRDVIVSAAALGGAFLWEISPEINFLTAFFCGVAGTAWFAVFGRDMNQT